MIQSIHIRNFRNIRSADIDLERLTVFVGANAVGKSSVLAFLKLTEDSAFEKFQETMRQFVPQFRRIRIQRRGIRKEETEYIRIEEEAVPRRSIRSYLGEALLFDFANAQNIPARAVSEGTLLLLGLLTVLHGPEQPNVLLMDDIDQGLHPLAQRKLLEVLAQLMAEYPKLQVLATSHSPYLLDGLRPEQVRCMTTDPEGYAVVNKLGDHPEFAKWQDEMAPGEMWSMFGEKWMPRKGVDP